MRQGRSQDFLIGGAEKRVTALGFKVDHAMSEM